MKYLQYILSAVRGWREPQATKQTNKSRPLGVAHLLAALVLFPSVLFGAATVKWTASDFTAQPLAVKRITMQPLAYATNATSVITLDRRTVSTDSSGVAWFSNVVAGTYRSTLEGPNTTTTITNNIPDGSGIVEAKDTIGVSTNASGTVAYSQAAANSRFVLKSGDTMTGALTNASGFYYNGERLTNSAAGVSQTNWPYTAITNAPWTTNASDPNAITNWDTRLLNLTNVATLSLTNLEFRGTQGIRITDTNGAIVLDIPRDGSAVIVSNITATGVFTGDGSGLTNLTGAGTSGALTNNESRTVTLTNLNVMERLQIGPTNATSGTNWLNFVTQFGVGRTNTISDAGSVINGVGMTNGVIYGTVSDTVSRIASVTTEASATPSTTLLTLQGTQNAFRVWTGEQPLKEAYVDLWVRTNAGTVFKVRMYRWGGRIINAATNATVSLGTTNGRTLSISAMTVPSALESVSGSTNLAYVDKAGPPLWQPSAPHITLKTNNGVFSFYPHPVERHIFISEFDGDRWSPIRWVNIESNAFISVRCTYKQVALATYDGAPMRVVADAVVGGTSRAMTLAHGVVRSVYVTNVAQLGEAITNAVYGDEIVLAPGTYEMTFNVTNHSFASNALAGLVGPEGITIRGNAGARDSTILLSTNNLGGWGIAGTVSERIREPSCFKNITFRFGTNTAKFHALGGTWAMEDVRFTGSASDTVNFTPEASPLVLDALRMQVDRSGADNINFYGGAFNTNSRARLIDCSSWYCGAETSHQTLTTHNGLDVEVYGGTYGHAPENVVANGADTEALHCFFTSFTQTNAAGGARCINGFACNATGVGVWGPVTNGYVLFCKGNLKLERYFQAFYHVAHNRFYGAARALFNYGAGDFDIIGNIVSNATGEGILVQYSSSAIGTNYITGNTIKGSGNAMQLWDDTLWVKATNNAALLNTTGLYSSGSRLMMGYNTIDESIAGWSMGLTDTTGDAAMDARYIPTASGNVDAGTGLNVLGHVGDSDPWGMVWIYGESLVPRGARSRQAIYTGARLHPDFW